MLRCCLALLCLTLTALPAWAHFLWLLPGSEPNTVRLVFSDQLAPDDPALLERVKQAEIFVHDDEIEHTDLKHQRVDAALVAAIPAKAKAIKVKCVYGVFQRGASPASLLSYYGVLDRGANDWACWDCQPLQVIRAKDGKGFLVHWQGEPLANAEVVLIGAGDFKPVKATTDAQGLAAIDLAQLPAGLYGARARHVADKAGEYAGKPYAKQTSYFTYVFEHGAGKTTLTKAASPDPEATALLRQARAARVSWNKFPGFTAAITINVDGKMTRATLEVNDAGQVTLSDMPDASLAKWTRTTIGSVVGHRLANATELDTPCAFGDDYRDHPQGRLIHVLNDELHSSYRIRDRQITQVNRTMGGQRFSINMQENRRTEDDRFLPASYTVTYWDAKNAITKCESHTQTWQRVGTYDLPAVVRILTTTPEGTVTREITFSEVKLR